MKVEISNRRKFGKYKNIWKLNNTFLKKKKKRWDQNEITSKIRKYLKRNENGNQHTKTIDMQ